MSRVAYLAPVTRGVGAAGEDRGAMILEERGDGMDRGAATFDDQALFDMLVFWATATLNSAERVLSENTHSPWPARDTSLPDERTRSADAALMVLAMRNLLRAATFVCRQLEWRAAFDADAVLQRFNDQMPGVVDARDALEHFDEYAIGDGRLQRSNMVPYEFRLTRSEDGPVVSVGPIQIGVLRAREECRALVVSVLAVMALIDETKGDGSP